MQFVEDTENLGVEAAQVSCRVWRTQSSHGGCGGEDVEGSCRLNTRLLAAATAVTLHHDHALFRPSPRKRYVLH